MVVGLGLDICPIVRGAEMLANERFMNRVFSPEEQAYLAERGEQAAQSAAGMFAAKEAVLKALGTGMNGATLREVCVTHESGGRPLARLSGGAHARLEALCGKRVLLSITHDGGMAAAVAIAEGEDMRD